MMRIIGATSDLGADFKTGNIASDLIHHATFRVS